MNIDGIYDWITEPLQYQFMQSAFIAAILIGITCATIGTYVVLRRMAFIGDALSHTTLPGLVVAYLNGWSLFLGAIVAGLLTALGIGWLSRRDGVREDTAIGVLFTGMFALGIMLLTLRQSFQDLTHLLFGNILGVSHSDLRLIAIITAVVIVALMLFHKEFELTSVDPVFAEVIGLRTSLMRYGLLVLLALTVVTGIQAVGVVLTSALLVTPAAAASLVTERLARMMLVACGVAVFSSVAGIYASYYEGVASGSAIVLISTGCFVVAWCVRLVRTMVPELVSRSRATRATLRHLDRRTPPD